MKEQGFQHPDEVNTFLEAFNFIQQEKWSAMSV
jgi:hypothetical protein